MTMAADKRACMRQARAGRYDEVTVAQVCHAALRELRARTGSPDPGPAWDDLSPAERESMTEAVTVARALIRLPGSRHAADAAPRRESTEPGIREKQVADELVQFITAAMTPA